MPKVLTVGEPLVVFASQEQDATLSESQTFKKYPAGAELNVAVGIAKLGYECEYITQIGDDPFGVFLRSELKKAGVGTKYVRQVKTGLTGIQFKQLVTKGDPNTIYYRRHSAATQVTVESFETVKVHSNDFVHITGIFPAISTGARQLTDYLINEARSAGATITFDPNLRPSLWADENTMITNVNSLALTANIVMPGLEEGQLLTGQQEPDGIANFYLQQSPTILAVIIKLGPEGAYLKLREKSGRVIPGFTASRVVDTVGAGDGFDVGVLMGMMAGKSLPDAVTRGNAIGAMAIQKQGDNEGYPNKQQLETFLM